MNNFARTLFNEVAKRNKVKLTDAHLKLLDYTYDYYQQNKVAPLYVNIQKHTGYNRLDIESLFPHGLQSLYTWTGIPIQSMKQLCKPVVNVSQTPEKNIYLDHAATTYLRPQVQQALLDYYQADLDYGNPSSSSQLGKRAANHVLHAKQQLAKCLHVEPHTLIFTSGGTEANNMAIKGIAFQYLHQPAHIISSKIEHPSVLKTLAYLETLGFLVEYLDAPDGIVTADSVAKAITPNTILVTLMLVNNELGTMNPIQSIAKLCQSKHIPFMVDAVQGFGKLKIRPQQWGITLLTLSGHKIYAPKGIGALYISPAITLTPLLHGGGQEYDLRSGTENIGHIIALGMAAKLAYCYITKEQQHYQQLQQYFLQGLSKTKIDYIVYGASQRIPNIINIGFAHIDSGSLLLSLHQAGIYVSAASACQAGNTEQSHVITHIQQKHQYHYGAIRFSFGLTTNISDIHYLLDILPEIIDKLLEQT